VYVACLGKMGNSCRTSDRKPGAKEVPATPRHWWEDEFNNDQEGIGCESVE
jgi:hypothetical protein